MFAQETALLAFRTSPAASWSCRLPPLLTLHKLGLSERLRSLVGEGYIATVQGHLLARPTKEVCLETYCSVEQLPPSFPGAHKPVFNYKAGGKAPGSGVRLAIVCLTSSQGNHQITCRLAAPGSGERVTFLLPGLSPWAAEKEGLLFFIF